MTGPAKGTKLAQNTLYHKMVNIFSSVGTILSVSCKILLIKLFIDNKMFTSMASVNYHTIKLKNVMKFYVPTWLIFAAPVTFVKINTESLLFKVNFDHP